MKKQNEETSPFTLSEVKMITLDQGRKQVLKLIFSSLLTADEKKFLKELAMAIPEETITIKYVEAIISWLPHYQIVGEGGIVDQIKEKTLFHLLPAPLVVAIAKLGKLTESAVTLEKVGARGFMQIPKAEVGFFKSVLRKNPKITFTSYALPREHKVVLFGIFEKQKTERVEKVHHRQKEQYQMAQY